jgi:DNA-binding response OmpR family regulator
MGKITRWKRRETEHLLTARAGLLSIRACRFDAESIEFEYGQLSIDWSRGSVASALGRVTLSRTELRLLAALVHANGEVVANGRLIDCAWPSIHLDESTAALLDAYVRSLRHWLASIGAAGIVKTIHGVGYSLISECPATSRRPDAPSSF